MDMATWQKGSNSIKLTHLLPLGESNPSADCFVYICCTFLLPCTKALDIWHRMFQTLHLIH